MISIVIYYYTGIALGHSRVHITYPSAVEKWKPSRKHHYSKRLKHWEIQKPKKNQNWGKTNRLQLGPKKLRESSADSLTAAQIHTLEDGTGTLNEITTIKQFTWTFLTNQLSNKIINNLSTINHLSKINPKSANTDNTSSSDFIFPNQAATFQLTTYRLFG